MKGISLSPPYGTLIALAATHPDLGKKIETRGWATNHRGPLAIHQTAAPGPKGTTEAALWDRCLSGAIGKALLAAGLGNPARLPRGKIVAVVKLRGCLPIGSYYDAPALIPSDTPPILVREQEVAFGDYRPGRWAWLFANIRALPVPVPTRGYQGLWNVPADIEQAIARQLAPGVPCPHCGAAYDVSHRLSGDTVLCAHCGGWATVRFGNGGTQLLAAAAPI